MNVAAAAAAPEAIQEPVFTPEEQAQIDEFSKQIDVTDTNLVFSYGAHAQQGIAEFSDTALENVKTKDLDEVGDMIANLVAELKDFSADEDVVCITENDACGVDAIQVLLGCSVGKGNLLFHLRGKQAFSFYNRKTGKAVRLVLRPTPAEYQTKEERFRYLQDAAPASLFDVKPAVLSLPEKARLFQSLPCDGCGEVTAEHLLRLENGKKLCLDCFRAYNRFDV